MKKLYLIDGNAYIFRAYYGVKAGLQSPTGLPTNAVYGFKSMLVNFLIEHQPEYCAVVFDPKGQTLRHQIYTEYKANRQAAPEDLAPQFGLVHEFVNCCNLPLLVQDGFEADDLIASLAQKFGAAQQPDCEIVILSPDKDLMQLINDHVSMLDSSHNRTFDAAKVKEKLGVAPHLVAEYLSLVGDTADNIPGAKGIGPKTAAQLLQQYSGLKEIFAQLDANQLDLVSKGVQQKLVASRQNIELSHSLVLFQPIPGFNPSLKDFKLVAPDLLKLQGFYTEMGFRKDEFLRTLEDQQVGVKKEPKKYKMVTQIAELQKIVERIKQVGQFCLDLETTSLKVHDAKIIGIALSFGENTACYVPSNHQCPGTENTKTENTEIEKTKTGNTETENTKTENTKTGNTEIEKTKTENTKTLTQKNAASQIPLEDVLATLKPLLNDSKLRLIGHNLKYEWMIFQNYNIQINCQLEDTMIQSYLLDSESHRHSLDVLALHHLEYPMLSFKAVTQGKTFAAVGLEEATQYAAEDADITWQLHQILHPKIVEHKLEQLYQQLEIPLCKVLATVETHGVKIDVAYLQQIEDNIKQELAVLQRQVYDLAGEEFNLESPKQLQKILFEKLKLPTFKKTKTGFSTDASVLVKLAHQHPIAKMLLQHRVKTKLVNTYLTVLPKMVQPKTGRIHTSYNQSIAATGRLSSQNPNLQNIPIRGQEGGDIRRGFVPEAGCLLLAADYSQIELRILAHISEDTNLVEAFKQGADIHTETAATLFNLSAEKISADMRRTAKAINFGILYGMGSVRLAEVIGIDRAQAKKFIEAYFERFDGIRNYRDYTLQFAKEHGYVETLLGRQRNVDGIRSANRHLQAAAERIAINSRIQGSAADVIKKSMVDIHQIFGKNQMSTKMIMQVHDELVFEVKAEHLQATQKIVVNKMENAMVLRVPLRVSVGVGQNWQIAHS